MKRSGYYKPGARTRANGYQGPSGWARNVVGDSVRCSGAGRRAGSHSMSLGMFVRRANGSSPKK